MFSVINGCDYGDDEEGYISLNDEHGEIVYWDMQEWIDEPSVMAAIVEAIRIGYEEGPEVIRARLGTTVTEEAATGQTIKFTQEEIDRVEAILNAPENQIKLRELE